MGTTPKGLIYPEDGDFVQQGDAAIQALAGGVDGLLDDYVTRTINGMPRFVSGRRSTDAGPLSAEASILTSSDWTLDASTVVLFFAGWGSCLAGSSTSSITARLRLNGLSGTRIAQARANGVAANTYTSPNSLFAYKVLAAGTYSFCLTLQCSGSTVSIDADTDNQIAIMAMPLKL